MTLSAATTTQLADQFRELNAQVIVAVEECPDDQWTKPSIAENWPIAVVAHHIAIVNSGFAGMVERLASGETFTPTTGMDEIHESNARHAREYANVGKPEVLGKLRDGGSAVEAALRKIEDDRLDAHAGVFGGNPLTIAQVVEYVVIGHTAEHYNSIRETLDGR